MNSLRQMYIMSAIQFVMSNMVAFRMTCFVLPILMRFRMHARAIVVGRYSPGCLLVRTAYSLLLEWSVGVLTALTLSFQEYTLV